MYLRASLYSERKKFSYRQFMFMSIPLILSAFTHLWNPIGFPAIHSDEAIYLMKALHVMKEGGLYEKGNYNHPFFGQLFLAGIFKMIGYPDSMNPVEGDVHSIERLWLVPRVLMGLLAVVDTFLIYKIAERRYNRNVAFIASVLFAVMPLSWMIRRTYLDSILLPFLLSSILFALYARDSKNNTNKTLAIVVSGIFLGLSVLTKIPVFAMIPLVGFLIYTNSNRSLKNLGLWFIPVILIPLIWPVESIWQGHFDDWTKDFLWQTTGRVDKGVFEVFEWLVRADPVLLVLGIFGSIFAGAIKRDFLTLTWLVPLVMLYNLLGYTQPHFFIVAIPAFSIAGAIMIEYLLTSIKNRKLQRAISTTIISGILIFGLASTILLISLSVNLSYFKAVAFVANKVQDTDSNKDTHHDAVTIIGFPRAKSYLLIPKYIFDRDVSMKLFRNIKDIERIQTQNYLIITNNDLERFLSSDRNIQSGLSGRLEVLNNDAMSIAKFSPNHYNFSIYPYANMKDNYAGLLRPVEVRANY
jgi:dolichyl-phosphate-mannose-protein mannosyltransferase